MIEVEAHRQKSESEPSKIQPIRCPLMGKVFPFWNSYTYCLHPVVKLLFYIGFSFAMFHPVLKSIRWVLLIFELALVVMLKMDLKLFLGFFKLIALNFIPIYLLFYFASYDWWLAFQEFGSYALTVIIMFLGIFLFVKSTPTFELVVALRHFKIPDKLVLAIAISISWLPVLTREIQRIIIIQKSRGYRIRLWRLQPILIPAILAILDYSINLSTSLKARGFN